MVYIRLNRGIKDAVDMLTSTDAGMLFKAILSGSPEGLYGDAKLAYMFVSAYIEDGEEPSYREVQRAYGKMGGRPKKTAFSEEKTAFSDEKPPFETEKPPFKPPFQEEESAPCPPSSPSSLPPTPPITIPPIIPQPLKEEEGNEITTTTRTREEDMPFGLTEEEALASLQRDQQIEDAAMNAGLNTSITSLTNARRMADTYGLDKLLDAIQKTPLSAAKPSWNYVEGILKGAGTKPTYQKPAKTVSAQRYEQRPYTEAELGTDNDFAALVAEAKAMRDG